MKKVMFILFVSVFPITAVHASTELNSSENCKYVIGGCKATFTVTDVKGNVIKVHTLDQYSPNGDDCLRRMGAALEMYEDFYGSDYSVASSISYK